MTLTKYPYALAERSALVAPPPSGDTSGVVDTAALQPLLTAAQAAKGTLQLQAGIYYTTGLTTTALENQPILRGVGTYATTLRAVSTAVAVTYVGGSGGLSRGRISDMTMDSTAGTGTAIQLRGIGGVVVENVQFTALAVGVTFYNLTAATFTEFCEARDCLFDDTVTLAVWYRMGSGDASFHGTGFRDCVFQQKISPTGPIIKIDALARVYNAPFDGTFFADDDAQPLVDSDTALLISTFGTIRTETDGDLVWCTYPAGTDMRWLHTGYLQELTEGIAFGTRFRQSNRRQENSDGSVSAELLPVEFDKSLVATNNDLCEIGNGKMILAAVHVSATNYDQYYLVSAMQDAGSDTGFATVIVTHNVRNTPGWAASTFSVTSATPPMLRIANAAFTGTVDARIRIMETLGRDNFPLR